MGLAACALALACRALPRAPAGGLAIDRVASTVSFSAVVDREAFERGAMAGYHLIVWEEGGAAGDALLRSAVSDTAVLEALEGLGAEPGDALEIDTWEERDDAGSAAPDRVIRGPRVEILVGRVGEAPRPIAEILVDAQGRSFDMRFGGHRANISKWGSGCVVCLVSCPGGKIGNASHTVRDWVRGDARFRVAEGALPPDGSEVRVHLRLADGA